MAENDMLSVFVSVGCFFKGNLSLPDVCVCVFVNVCSGNRFHH